MRAMDNRQKRNLTFVTIGLLFVLSGVEYGRWLSAAAWTCVVMTWLAGNLPLR